MPLDRNPTAKVARYRESAPEIRYLTLEQVQHQMGALTERPLLRMMVATLIYAGLRREELLWLQMDDLVPPSKQSPNGLIRVRAKTVNGISWQPKTKKNRAVPVSRDLRANLDEWKSPRSDQGWFFPSPNGARWNTDNFSQSLRKMNDAAGLPWTCLDYRHTFGSLLAQKGLSLYQIATLMGNSPDICKRHYASLSLEDSVHTVEFTQ